MGTITFIPAKNMTKRTLHGYKIDTRSYLIINIIRIILETIVKNTLKFNKLTSTDEVYDDIVYRQTERPMEIGFDDEIDIKLIEKTCGALCKGNKVLIKLEINGKAYYKLNSNENI
jgi:hypothetical protein